MSLLHESLWVARQSLYGDRIVKVHYSDLKLRATIRRNAYDMQSTAEVAFLTEIGWKKLTEIPIHDLKIHGFSYTAPDRDDSTWRDAMREDLTTLINLGKTVMG